MPTWYWFTSIVNANFSVNPMSPIIFRWKLVKHLHCFGDNRRTKDARKIKFCSLKACCLTLFSYSISHNFPALKSWNEKSEENLKKSWWPKKTGCPKRQACEKLKESKEIWEKPFVVSSQICRRSGNLQIRKCKWSKIDTYRCGTKCNVSTKFFPFESLNWHDRIMLSQT